MPATARPQHLPAAIAIDGGAASGKSTLGRVLVERFGYRFLDTGVTYRALTLAALRERVPASDPAACAALAARITIGFEPDGSRAYLNGEDVTGLIRGPEVEAAVSRYSAIPGVRQVMVQLQRRFAAGGPSVLAGRDIGTVVLPGAPLKFYLTATEDARATRRSEQAATWGTTQQAADARRDISSRDAVDSTRATSPLQAAPDAIVIDTTDLPLQQVIDTVIEKVLACAAA